VSAECFSVGFCWDALSVAQVAVEFILLFLSSGHRHDHSAQHWECAYTRERKKRQPNWEFDLGQILYLENPNNSTKKLLKLVN
jgi:hypothetical protein